MHKNGVIPSILHQVFKYLSNGTVNKVVADGKPFIKAEAYVADAKFYFRGKTAEPRKKRLIPAMVEEQQDDSSFKGELLLTMKAVMIIEHATNTQK